ncbi:hypothetical protein AWB66_03357 [Caballeronia telluris]|uniref:Uncharacterized protein n=2 Tax=Caballeronia telluris TaxID=326475 RepID=A0A158IT10_9BURK|nr:hypothetical protein AWB66_03357 [Caballeronia telluris]
MTSKSAHVDGAKLLPSNLADSELDHLERVIESFARSNKPHMLGWLDDDYWQKRVRTLAKENDLVAAQRQRVLRLLDLLERKALLSERSRAA